MAKQANGSGWNWRQHTGTAAVAAIAAVFGLAASLWVSGQEREPTQAPIITSGGTPAGAGLTMQPAGLAAGRPRSGNPSLRLLPISMVYRPQQSSQSYPPGQQAPAPIVRRAETSNGNPVAQNEWSQGNTQPPLANQQGNGDAALNATDDPNYASAQVIDGQNTAQENAQYNAQENAGYDALDEAEQTDQAPPPLPEYDQPPAPEDDYLWTPGYWGFNTGYYWVPGAWVAPPFYGALWTPPWWGCYGNRYFFHRGFWGTHIGYYGGINYGHGYVGSGYYGGYWQGRNFYYNRSVTNVNVSRVRYVYDRPVVLNNVVHTGRSLDRTSYNGGTGGVHFQPRPYELVAMREAHYAPVAAQVLSHREAAANRGQFFSHNHGQPRELFQQRPLSSPRTIADAPQRLPIAGQTYGQGARATFGAGRTADARMGDARTDDIRTGDNRTGDNRTGNIRAGGYNSTYRSGNTVDNRPTAGARSPATSEINRPSLDNGSGSPRNDMIRQRTGLWGGDRERGRASQPSQPTMEGQSVQDRTQEQQRELRSQQQQQVEAARQGQRNVQAQQQQYRNQVFEQQRDARQQLQNQQLQQQQLTIQQQRVQQQQQIQQQQVQQQNRNIQFQQQRAQAMQQQRQVYEQQRQLQQQQRQMQQQERQLEQQQRPQMPAQRIDARPAPQMGGAPGAMHGRPR